MMKSIIILNYMKTLYKETHLRQSDFEMSVTVSNPIMCLSEYACFDQLVL